MEEATVITPALDPEQLNVAASRLTFGRSLERIHGPNITAADQPRWQHHASEQVGEEELVTASIAR